MNIDDIQQIDDGIMRIKSHEKPLDLSSENQSFSVDDLIDKEDEDFDENMFTI